MVGHSRDQGEILDRVQTILKLQFGSLDPGVSHIETGACRGASEGGWAPGGQGGSGGYEPARPTPLLSVLLQPTRRSHSTASPPTPALVLKPLVRRGPWHSSGSPGWPLRGREGHPCRLWSRFRSVQRPLWRGGSAQTVAAA